MERKERLRAWTLVDELVVDIHQMTWKLPGSGPEDLPGAMRSRVLRSGLLIVKGVHGTGAEFSASLTAALAALSELRYFLYLARRLGLIDLRRYRGSCSLHEKIEKSLREMISPQRAAPSEGASLSRRPHGAPEGGRQGAAHDRAGSGVSEFLAQEVAPRTL